MFHLGPFAHSSEGDICPNPEQSGSHPHPVGSNCATSKDRLSCVAPYELDENAVDVWFARPESVHPSQQAKLRATLSLDEHRRLERFRSTKDRDLFLIAHAHLRVVLSRYAPVSCAEWQFGSNPFGRPFLIQPPLSSELHFSLSHTPGLVAVAVSRIADIGIDVESIHRTLDPRTVSRTAFATDELRALDALASDDAYRRRFFELWTLKEAYAKATGLGMSLGFQNFSFCIGTSAIHLQPHGKTEDNSAEAWDFQLSRPADGFQMALAARRPRGATTIRWMQY